MPICHGRGIILGYEGAGKTTLLRRLENKSLEELKSIKSTEILDIHVNSFELLEEEQTIRSMFFFSKLFSFC